MLSDRFGRKWPLVINLLLCASFELGAGFVTTFSRGLGSGILQQGYAFGYLVAAVINLRLVPHTSHSWRALFWASAAISAFAAVLRALVPESEVFLRAKALERENGATTGNKTRVFIRQIGAMLKKHWLLCIYAVLLMTGI